MSTVFIDESEAVISLDNNAIVVHKEGEKVGMIPLLPLERLIIIGNVDISTGLIRRLMVNGTTTIFLSGRSLSLSGIIYGHRQNDARRRVCQIRAMNNEEGTRFINEIISKKLSGYVSNIKHMITKSDFYESYFVNKINTIQNAIDRLKGMIPDRDIIMGIEGSSTSAYFDMLKEFFDKSLGFNGRNRRPPEDPVNSMLSLVYTTLHYEIVRELEMAGLDPFIGYLHSIENGRESLACDFVEIFRPTVDIMIFDLFRERVLSKDDFYYENGGCYLRKEKRKDIFLINEDFHKKMRTSYRKEIYFFIRRITGEEVSLSGI